MTHHSKIKIVLASSSTYRKSLLSKILPDFESASPNIDESRQANEAFPQLAQRLSIEKAKALSVRFPNALIIGSDQVAQIGTKQLSKPENANNCFQQLQSFQGETAYFHTGLCILNSKTGKLQSAVECYQTRFRSLTDQQIRHYITLEPSFDCAGGFKMEGLGIALFEKIQGNDPNILIGLPLIKLIDMLNKEGVAVL